MGTQTEDSDRWRMALRLFIRVEMAKRNGMKEAELSRLSGVSPSQLNRMLDDEPDRTAVWRLDQLLGIAKALGMTLTELLEGAAEGLG